jgi:hypothetical protein
LEFAEIAAVVEFLADICEFVALRASDAVGYWMAIFWFGFGSGGAEAGFDGVSAIIEYESLLA